jgi:DNA-directed RNA polymerase alpha subunit
MGLEMREKIKRSLVRILEGSILTQEEQADLAREIADELADEWSPMGVATIESKRLGFGLELSVRGINVLLNGRIRSLTELESKSEKDLLRIKNCGRKTAKEIKQALIRNSSSPQT